ncbi:sodium:solute symporter family transporter [Fervidibacillus albus]|uniref:Transporter n=1 Tax=Fervidibacillus albus TaxID=2980026 RepID=A0A9E8RV11_9BACI|nr:hypothetical protein [Fervidibacillus albus]WAA08941.1 hypothetical protein OE104_10035 [Fervidibacillus albus]
MTALIVVIYFAFLIAIGWFFRKFTNTMRNYFAGGGKLLWWMVGSTAFMTQFSAWTFTGAAGKAFTDGLAVVFIFLGNAVGYFFNYLFFAAKARQMRVITPIDGIRLRYGKLNEQVFTWATVPSSILQAAVWLNGLAIFGSAVTGVSVPATIAITGIVVVFMSVIGGSWAVVSSDFLQMVIIMSVTFIASIVAISKSGGVLPILEKGLPESAVAGQDVNYMFLFIAWAITIFVKQFFSTNNMLDSYRYITAKDTKNARKAALLAFGLMLIGSFFWFLPAWYVAANYPDPSTWGIDTLGDNIKDAAYFVFVKNELPSGMIGLMLGAMFAATMSSMDSGLNKNSGIFVRNFYNPVLRKGANEKELMIVSKIATVIFGVIIISVALLLSLLKQTSLFNVMMMIGTLVSFPILIPALLGYFVKKTPDWAGWATVLVGVCVSTFVAFIAKPEMVQNILGLSEPLTAREWGDIKSVTLGIILHSTITIPFFFLTKLFYRGLSKERQKEVDLFFNNISTEVVAEHEDEAEVDRYQRKVLGKLILLFGGLILLLILVPNSLSGRLLFGFLSAIIISIGFALVKSANKTVVLASNDIKK